MAEVRQIAGTGKEGRISATRVGGGLGVLLVTHGVLGCWKLFGEWWSTCKIAASASLWSGPVNSRFETVKNLPAGEWASGTSCLHLFTVISLGDSRMVLSTCERSLSSVDKE